MRERPSEALFWGGIGAVFLVLAGISAYVVLYVGLSAYGWLFAGLLAALLIGWLLARERRKTRRG